MLDNGKFLHSRVEAWAGQTPNAPAVVFGGEVLSYAELNRRASRLAAHLRALGVGPDILVGLFVERSAELAVGLLAVLRAGGAYLPLDPTYPAERLAYMLEDARPRVLLTLERLRGAVPRSDAADAADAAIVVLDRALSSEAAGEASGAEPPAVDAENLAYVIYTSGSTGRPKGAGLTHRGLANLADAQLEAFGTRPDDRCLQFASLSFDASIFEITMAWGAGAAIHLATRDELLPGPPLARVLRERGITNATLPPSALATLERDEFPALRTLVVAGEACPPALADSWSRGRKFFNAYGPTETTVWGTVDLYEGGGQLTIGRPILNVDVLLLDGEMAAVADGGEGELCLGGANLGRGFLGRPDLTAERFIPHPEPRPGKAGERLYRTGDLARRLPDGDIAFLGRIDHQVKLRGFRIELGEIEAALAAWPGTREAVVTVREDSGDKRLVAYVVPRPGEELPADELRAFLKSRLPDPMVPSLFVPLAEMPRLPNGKVDRRALPAPPAERDDAGYVAPRTPVEEVLAGIYAELLRVDRIGVEDELASLGAHSLLAARVVARAREALGVELPLPEVLLARAVSDLARLADRMAGAGPVLPPITRAPRDRPLPLSFPQERVWFLQQLAPHSIAYNVQATLDLDGRLDAGALHRALREIVRRHEVLRTTFPTVDDGPVQEVHPEGVVPLPRIDLSALPAERRRDTAEALVADEIGRPFDITRLPLIRWTLLRLAPEEHLLIQVEHHFVHDGWSFAVLMGEIRDLYRAFADGQPSPLPKRPIQYADFAAWQHEWMTGDVLGGQLAYWKERLAGSPPGIELPSDRPRPKAHSFRGGALRADLPPELYRDLVALGKRQGATLFMTMLAAFDALLYRLTGEGDLPLASGVANRRHRETEGMLGMVVNTILLRTRLDGGTSFRELLSRARETMLGAHAHQDLPFERLVQELQPDRDPGRNPLSQIMFSFHDTPVPAIDFAELRGRLRERHNSSAKADFNLVFLTRGEHHLGRRPLPEEETLTGVWEYSADLFDAPTVERFWDRYLVLLEAVARDQSGGEVRVSDLPLLSAAESVQIAAWSHGATMDVPERPVHELFAAAASRAAQQLAVSGGSGGGASLTYGELDERSARLANRLRALGVGVESRVGVLLDRSPDLLVALLGALRAGAAYVPLDPDYPAERLAYLLSDAGVEVLVTRSGVVELPETEARILLLDALLDASTGPAPGPVSGEPMPEVSPANLAYVIYTSGSTGRPKGVEVSHGALLNLVRWHQRSYGVRPEDRASLVAGLGFDAAVWEIWPYLTAGASLHLPDAETRTSPAKLVEWLAEERVTIAFLPTPLAEAALAEEIPGGLMDKLALRFLLTGGDRLHGAPGPGLPFQLVNHYGPTEAAVVSTAVPVEPGSPGAPPIGRPIHNFRALLLDRDLRRVPQGTPGELCVAGAGLARGYHNRPDLTAERFLPAEDAPGERLYRTGDLARWRPDGNLEFLGRIDQQVKVRGFRIEPGEIEAALAEQPGVGQVAVVPRSLPSGELALVAYVTGDGLDLEDLRHRLARRLPEFMVPAVFVPLAEMPLTSHGKVDRRALPEPDLESGDGFEEPGTETEELLAELWSELIGVERVGANDDFFRLGGHSLMATRMLSRLRQTLQVEVPLESLFESSSLRAFALVIEEQLLADQDFEELAG